MSQNLNALKVGSLKVFNDTILVEGMDFAERISQGGIVLINDDMKNSGIRPRWAKVYKTGPEVKEIQVGQYIMISHGRWSRGIDIIDDEGEKTIRKVDPNDILLVSEEPVQDYTMSDKAI